MRKGVLALLLIVSVGAGMAFAIDPNDLNKVTFQNTTGTKIEMIFLSPGDSDYWGPDLIGADYVIKDGGTISYYVHYPSSPFKFDIMATDDQGNKFELRDFSIPDGKQATVRLTKSSLNSSAPSFTLETVSVTNNTGNEIEYLFISPNDSEAWGADLLDSETTLADGDTHKIVVPVGKDKVKYNLLAYDENADEYMFDVSIDPKKTDTVDVSIESTDMIQ
jgi:hypothetical protein